MGYIPPVKDDQMLIYGNRKRVDHDSIYATPVTEKVSFLDALQNNFTYNRIHRNIHDKADTLNPSKVNLEKKIKNIEQKVTGKGTKIDIKI